jgi:ribosomal protein S18 acetylase RimI-like enzyme
VIDVPGAVGSVVETATDDPWLSALVPEDPEVDLAAALAAAGYVRLAVFACGERQVRDAVAAGFTELVARQPAMGIELGARGVPSADARGVASAAADAAGDIGDVERGADLAELGALSDLAYGNRGHEIERTLARLPPASVHTYGVSGADGRLLSGGLVFDHEDDANVQYVATRPEAQRAGHAALVIRQALAGAEARGARTATLTASESGRALYERLGFRTVGEVELRRRPRAA